MARFITEVRNVTTNHLLDRLQDLEAAREEGAVPEDTTNDPSEELLARGYDREINRLRNLLSAYCGNANPPRDFYLQKG